MKEMTTLARGSLEAGSVKTYTPGLNKFRAFVKDRARSSTVAARDYPRAT